MLDVDVRRIQRVGTSSLVVTLPKNWLKILGLDQGSQVILVNEGDGIKIIPVDRKGGRKAGIDLSSDPAIMVSSIPVCIYLSGVEKARVKLPDKDMTSIIRKRMLNFMGLHLMETEDNEVEVEVLLDMDKVDISLLIKSLGSILNRLIVNLKKSLKEPSSLEEIDLLRQDFMRTLYVILRYLITRKSGSENITKVQTALSASYVSLAVELLYSIAYLLNKYKPRGSDSQFITSILDKLEYDANILLHILANPSIRRLEPLISNLKGLLVIIEENMYTLKDPSSAFMLGKIHDAISVLLLAAYVIVCIVLNSKINY